MKVLLPFGVFVFIVVTVVGLNLWGFWGTMAYTALLLLTVTVLTAYYPTQMMSIFGIVVVGLGKNNNYRLGALALLTLLSFIAAVKYGPGEPLLFSTYRELKEEAPTVNTAKFQRVKNYILWGEKKTNAERHPEEQTQPKMARTWLFWKLTGVFFLMTLFSAPFAFADEMVQALENIADFVRKKHDEMKQDGPVAGASFSSTSSSTSSSGTQKAGWFGRLYGSSLASEFTIHFLQKLAALFTKVAA